MNSIIIGAGTYGEVFLAFLQESGVSVIGFLDDDSALQGKVIRGVPVLGPISCLRNYQNNNVDSVYCPIGNNRLRVEFLKMAKSLGFSTPNYIHPSAVISPSVILGEGVYVMLGATIMPYTVIRDYSIISMGVHLAHHCLLEEGSFLSTGCNFGASIHAHKLTYCGIGSTIMTGIHELGTNCLIGAGAVVIHDVPDNAIMAGVPAKLIRYNE